MKEIKDYLHLYLGCECIADNRPAVIDSVSTHPDLDTVTARFTDSNDYNDWAVFNDLSEIKPILRPLSDMTEEEGFKTLCLNNIYSLQYEGKDQRFMQYRQEFRYNDNYRRSKIKHEFFPIDPKKPEAVIYLLSKHFDLFGLIEVGLAIDKTTIV